MITHNLSVKCVQALLFRSSNIFYKIKPKILSPISPIERVHVHKDRRNAVRQPGRPLAQLGCAKVQPRQVIERSISLPSLRPPDPRLPRTTSVTHLSIGWGGKIQQNNNTGNMVRRFSKFPKKPADWVAPSAPLAERKQVFLYVPTGLGSLLGPNTPFFFLLWMKREVSNRRTKCS